MRLKTVRIPRNSEGLHCEVDGCIVNIRTGLSEHRTGRTVTSVEVICDDYAGEPKWRINGMGKKYANVRVIQLKGKQRKRDEYSGQWAKP